MADNIDHIFDSVSDFEDSGDEGSFYGFENQEQNANSDSDLDFSESESEEDQNKGEEGREEEVSDEDAEPDELWWSDQLSPIRIPDFVEASGIKFQLPDNPTPVE